MEHGTVAPKHSGHPHDHGRLHPHAAGRGADAARAGRPAWLLRILHVAPVPGAGRYDAPGLSAAAAAGVCPARCARHRPEAARYRRAVRLFLQRGLCARVQEGLRRKPQRLPGRARPRRAPDHPAAVRLLSDGRSRRSERDTKRGRDPDLFRAHPGAQISAHPQL